MPHSLVALVIEQSARLGLRPLMHALQTLTVSTHMEDKPQLQDSPGGEVNKNHCKKGTETDDDGNTTEPTGTCTKSAMVAIDGSAGGQRTLGAVGQTGEKVNAYLSTHSIEHDSKTDAGATKRQARISSSGTVATGQQLQNVATSSATQHARTPAPQWHLGVQAYAALLQNIVHDLAFRPAVLRVLLNLGLDPAMQSVPIFPKGWTKKDKQDALLDVPETLCDVNEEVVEIVGEDGEKNTLVGCATALEDGTKGGSESGSEAAAFKQGLTDGTDTVHGEVAATQKNDFPEALDFCGCEAMPKLNGRYERTRAYEAFDATRPVYELKFQHEVDLSRASPQTPLSTKGAFEGNQLKQPSGDADVVSRDCAGAENTETNSAAGGDADTEDTLVEKAGTVSALAGVKSSSTLLCFYWKFTKIRAGWWIGRAFGSNMGLLGYCPDHGLQPATTGWHIEKDGRRQTDQGHFVRAAVNEETEGSKLDGVDVSNQKKKEKNDGDNATMANTMANSMVGCNDSVAVDKDSEGALFDVKQAMGRVQGMDETTTQYFG